MEFVRKLPLPIEIREQYPLSAECVEKKKLAVTLFSKECDVPALYLRLRDMIATIADELKHKPISFKKEEATHSYEHIKNLNGIYVDDIRLGNMGIAHPTVSKKIDKKGVFAGKENCSRQRP